MLAALRGRPGAHRVESGGRAGLQAGPPVHVLTNPYGPKLRHLLVFSDPGRLSIGLDKERRLRRQ